MTLTRRQWFLLATLTLLWGLNWPMMKFSLREVSPLYFRALTMGGGTLVLAAVGQLAANELLALAGQPIGVLWLQAAALSWALGTVLMRRSALQLPTETVTVWMMLYGSAVFWALAPLIEPWPQWTSWHAATWGSLGYGVVLNFGYAQVIWFGLARTLPPQASTFSVMAVPLVGIASATLIVGEVARPTDWIAALLIALAIASATGAGARRPRSDNPTP